MKYTLEQIHKMTDNELCEAISQAREPRPLLPSQEALTDISPSGCWIISEYFVSVPDSKAWKPINWLDPQNWTRLMDEVAHTALNETAREMRFSNFGLTGYPDSKGAWNGAWNCRTGKVAINADSAARAVCEAWLYLEAQKNEIM